MEKKITLSIFLKSDDALRYKASTLSILRVYRNMRYTLTEWNNLATRIETKRV